MPRSAQEGIESTDPPSEMSGEEARPDSAAPTSLSPVPDPMGASKAPPEEVISLMTPEPLLVPDEATNPAHLKMVWRVDPYDEGRSGASLYLLPTGVSPNIGAGRIADQGGWWLSQSIGEPYRTSLGDSDYWRRNSKQVDIRGVRGLQMKVDFKGSDEPVCILFWNEELRSPHTDKRRNVLVSPQETCDGTQLEWARRLSPWEGNS